MQLNQILVSASRGDAITNYAFEVREILREFGHSNIFARLIDPGLSDEVLPLGSLEDRGESRDLLFFHGSIGDGEVHSFVMNRSERLILFYHNIAPAEYFREFDSGVASLLEEGRAELASLTRRAEAAIADSEYNAGELEALGCRRISVSPLIIDFAGLSATEPHAPTMRHFREMDGPLILFVGQLMPHKRPDLLLQAFHVLVTYLQPEALLVLCGWARIPKYKLAIQTFVQELNLYDAWIAGAVSPEQLVAFYRSADVFVTMSEHEGFCAPVLEAMAFDVPVIARPYGALPETVGSAGLLLEAGDGPEVTAEAVAAVVSDHSLRSRMAALGRGRLAEFSPEATRRSLREQVANLI